MRRVIDFVKRVVRAEPVVLLGLLEAVAALVVTHFGLLSPEQAASIVAAIAATHALIRSVVYAPDTVEDIVVQLDHA